MRVLVSATPLFLQRHRYLFKALAEQFPDLEYLPGMSFTAAQRIAFRVRAELWMRGWRRTLSLVERFIPLTAWDARIYEARSVDAETRIAKLQQQPDLIIHVFGMYAPQWHQQAIPYGMVLDYTEALAKRNYAGWAPFLSEEAWKAWWKCEDHAYRNAVHLFPFGEETKQSLIDDYGIDPGKITVIGSGGHFQHLFTGERSFGTKRILFYSADGDEFWRKGGDRVMGAFQYVKQRIPEAKLAVVGRKKPLRGAGVENRGWVSAEEMRKLFLTTDLVVAPSRCDPFPNFLIEAMNYGIPCVVSTADGMPEIVDNGVTGVVVPDPSGERLGAELVGILDDPQLLRSLSEASQRKVREKLNWNHVTEVMAETIRGLHLSSGAQGTGLAADQAGFSSAARMASA